MANNTYQVTFSPRLRGLTLCSVLLWPIGTMAETMPSPLPPTTQPKPETLFAEAVKLFKSGDSARALPLFVQLSEATNSPNAQLYVGYCQLNLENERAAHQAFSRAVQLTIDPSGTKYLATREAAQAELAKLSLRLASLTISFVELPTDAMVRVDGEIIDPTLLGSPIMVFPGLHHIDANSDGSKEITRDMALEAGEYKVLALLFEKQSGPTMEIAAPTPIADRGPTSRITTMGWIAGGVGIAGLGTFVVLGLQARSTYNKLQSDCPQGCADTGHHDDANTGKTYQAIANVGLALGIVGTLTGATLVYLGRANATTTAPSIEVAHGMVKFSYTGGF